MRILALLFLFIPFIDLSAQAMIGPYLDVLGRVIPPSIPSTPCPQADLYQLRKFHSVEMEVGDFSQEDILKARKYEFDRKGNYIELDWNSEVGDTIFGRETGKPDTTYRVVLPLERKEKKRWVSQKFGYDALGNWILIRQYEKVEEDRYGWHISELQTRGYHNGSLDSIAIQTFRPNGRPLTTTTTFFRYSDQPEERITTLISGQGLDRQTLNTLMGSIGEDHAKRAVYILDEVYTEGFRRMEDSIAMTTTQREYGRWAREIARLDSSTTREANLLSRRKIEWRSYFHDKNGQLTRFIHLNGDQVMESLEFEYSEGGELRVIRSLDYLDGIRRKRIYIMVPDEQGRIVQLQVKEKTFEMYSTVYALFEQRDITYDITYHRGMIDKFVRKDGFYFDVRHDVFR